MTVRCTHIVEGGVDVRVIVEIENNFWALFETCRLSKQVYSNYMGITVQLYSHCWGLCWCPCLPHCLSLLRKTAPCTPPTWKTTRDWMSVKLVKISFHYLVKEHGEPSRLCHLPNCSHKKTCFFCKDKKCRSVVQAAENLQNFLLQVFQERQHPLCVKFDQKPVSPRVTVVQKFMQSASVLWSYLNIYFERLEFENEARESQALLTPGLFISGDHRQVQKENTSFFLYIALQCQQLPFDAVVTHRHTKWPLAVLRCQNKATLRSSGNLEEGVLHCLLPSQDPGFCLATRRTDSLRKFPSENLQARVNSLRNWKNQLQMTHPLQTVSKNSCIVCWKGRDFFFGPWGSSPWTEKRKQK